ncbi:uncharacterized protein I206_105280 [Kwoniella pini CBS 10737]|uniref:Uncharacterized protein n=1 Tax=Kwoniella pini CBS 10737 TaxID=1296096 RepID=A0A1B9I4M5_9TREE|nr:uncharacterized protein I206_03811 [Kwoniella pini CBS 10737]OCF50487.1 hypothetical protein I206_03811 [Kwoniella pini CBS 10737]
MFVKVFVCLLATLSTTSLATSIDTSTPDSIDIAHTEVDSVQHSVRADQELDPGSVQIYGADGVTANVDGYTLNSSSMTKVVKFNADHKKGLIDVVPVRWQNTVRCTLEMGPGFNVTYSFRLTEITENPSLPYTKEVEENGDTLSITCDLSVYMKREP